jgi:hypothetical protein
VGTRAGGDGYQGRGGGGVARSYDDPKRVLDGKRDGKGKRTGHFGEERGKEEGSRRRKEEGGGKRKDEEGSKRRKEVGRGSK